MTIDPVLFEGVATAPAERSATNEGEGAHASPKPLTLLGDASAGFCVDGACELPTA